MKNILAALIAGFILGRASFVISPKWRMKHLSHRTVVFLGTLGVLTEELRQLRGDIAILKTELRS